MTHPLHPMMSMLPWNQCMSEMCPMWMWRTYNVVSMYTMKTMKPSRTVRPTAVLRCRYRRTASPCRSSFRYRRRRSSALSSGNDIFRHTISMTIRSRHLECYPSLEDFGMIGDGYEFWCLKQLCCSATRSNGRVWVVVNIIFAWAELGSIAMLTRKNKWIRRKGYNFICPVWQCYNCMWISQCYTW